MFLLGRSSSWYVSKILFYLECISQHDSIGTLQDIIIHFNHCFTDLFFMFHIMFSLQFLMQEKKSERTEISIAWKVSKYKVFSCPYFSVFWLNTEIRVNLRIQSKHGKIQTRKSSVFGYFSCSENLKLQ